MERRIFIINHEEYLKAINKTTSDLTPFGLLGSEHFGFLFTDLKPTEGYQQPENKESGLKFPYCSLIYKGILEDSQGWYNKFPNCCSEHKKLIGQKWFRKEDYKDLPSKVVKQLSFTEHHISQSINTTDWYQDITDYIEANIFSFGQLPLGYGGPVGLEVYFLYLKQFLTNPFLLEAQKIPANKGKRIVEYIELYESHEGQDFTDLNLLYSTFQKWLKTFPFKVKYFESLKEQLKNQLPVLVGKGESNPYTGLTKVKLHTQFSLIEALIKITKNTLERINSEKLFKEGFISDINKHRLDLINEAHRIKQAGIVGEYSKEEDKYRKLLKKWLKNEEEYFKSIAPLIGNTIPPDKSLSDSTSPQESKADKLKTELVKYGFFELEKVKCLTPDSKNQLVKLISQNMAYGIAMFDFLKFCDYLENEKGTKYKANIILTRLYNEKAKDGTTARHYRSSLVKNNPRYTSYLHKESVQHDYQEL